MQDKWKVRSALQEKTNEGVRCGICPRYCVISEGNRGFCKTRINENGILYAIGYGNPCSISVDPIEKKPLYHFHPGEKIYSMATGGCNFRCLNCQNWQISQTSPDELQHKDMSPEELIADTLRQNCSMIAFTYTEPTVFYEYMLDTARLAKEKGIKTVMISNGYISLEALSALVPYLDAVNIDLKCFDPGIHRLLTGGADLEPVLNTLLYLRNTPVWMEITHLLVPEFSTDSQSIRKMCEWLYENGFKDTPLHFSRFFPMNKLKHLEPTQENILLEARQLALHAGLRYVYTGNIHYPTGGNTYCHHCHQLLMERSGYRIFDNFMRTERCGFCSHEIPGRW